MHGPGEGVFERGSSVLEYWLANSEGFTLARPDGKRRVTSVVIDPDTRQARSLVVRRAGGRTQVLAADAVTAVDPHGRVLYVASGRRRETERRRRATAPPWLSAAPMLRGARATRQGARTSARHAAAAGSQARARLADLRPVLSRWAVVAARLTAAYAHGAAALARAAGVRARPVAAAYAHNALTLAAAAGRRSRAAALALAAHAREARLRGRWTPSSLPSWTKRVRRSHAVWSRIARR